MVLKSLWKSCHYKKISYIQIALVIDSKNLNEMVKKIY